jgi:hypothetical protein
MVKRLRAPTQGTRSRWSTQDGSSQRQHPRKAHHLAWMFGSAAPWIARTSLSKAAGTAIKLLACPVPPHPLRGPAGNRVRALL